MSNGIRIGICADTHGKPFPKFDDPDMVIHAGDLYDFDRLANNEHALQIVEAIRAHPTLFVRGNHDVTDSLMIMKAGDISGQLREFIPRDKSSGRPGLWFVGIGMGAAGDDGIALPDEGHLRPMCASVLKQATEKMAEGDQSILVTHYPAKVPEIAQFQRPNSSTRGFFFDCVRMAAEALQPIIVIQGHAHSMNGRTIESGGLKYVWPGPGGMMMVVTFDDSGFAVDVQKCPRPKKKGYEGPTLF